MRIGLAFKAFFQVLFNKQLASAYRGLTQPGWDAPVEKAPVSDTPPTSKPVRSEAITLLAALQREARFVDLVQESLDGYSDEQVGAAARDVLRDSRKVIDRMFALQPLSSSSEGDSMTTDSQVDAGLIRLTGNVAGEPPFTGTIMHQGWKVSQCEVPKWTGTCESANVVAPIELEIG